jgi:hypothetical protein
MKEELQAIARDLVEIVAKLQYLAAKLERVAKGTKGEAKR